MNYYELTYIVNPVLEEDDYKAVVEKYTKLLKDNGVEVDEIDEWGLRQLAYEMDKKGSGYYVNAYFHAPATAISAYERMMRIDDNILRFLTLKYDAKMLRHRELQKKNELPSIFQPVETEE